MADNVTRAPRTVIPAKAGIHGWAGQRNPPPETVIPAKAGIHGRAGNVTCAPNTVIPAKAGINGLDIDDIIPFPKGEGWNRPLRKRE